MGRGLSIIKILSRPDLRELFYFSIWLGQGVIWGGHSMLSVSLFLAECGSQSLRQSFFHLSFVGSYFCIGCSFALQNVTFVFVLLLSVFIK